MQQMFPQAQKGKIYNAMHAGARYLDDLLEMPLQIIPGLILKRDEMLKRGLYKMIEGERLSHGERQWVGFQVPSGKSAWALPILTINSMIYATYDGSPLQTIGISAIAIHVTLVALFFNSVMGEKLEKIVASLSKGDRTAMMGYLGSNMIDYARKMLDERGWCL